MAVDTQKRNTRQNEWNRQNIERISLVFQKGTKSRIDNACKVLGISKSEFARQAIEEKLKTVEK